LSRGTGAKSRGTLIALGIVLVVLAAVAFLGGAGAEGQVVQQVTRSFVLEPGQALTVVGRNGPITYEVWNGEAVRIEATAEAPGLARALWRLVGGGDVVHFSQDASGVEARADARTSLLGWADFKVRFHILVPREWAGEVRLTSANAHITATGLAGEAVLRTSNGPIAVQGMVGTLEARTSNGSISLADVYGSVTAVASNGAVTIAGGHLAGNGRVQTSNAPIELRAGLAPDASYDVTTTNGAVRALLPDPDVAVELTAMNGQISSAADMVVAARERERVAGRERERLAGRIGAGTAQLRIRTSNGEIALETVL